MSTSVKSAPAKSVISIATGLPIVSGIAVSHKRYIVKINDLKGSLIDEWYHCDYEFLIGSLDQQGIEYKTGAVEFCVILKGKFITHRGSGTIKGRYLRHKDERVSKWFQRLAPEASGFYVRKVVSEPVEMPVSAPVVGGAIAIIPAIEVLEGEFVPTLPSEDRACFETLDWSEKSNVSPEALGRLEEFKAMTMAELSFLWVALLGAAPPKGLSKESVYSVLWCRLYATK